MKDFDSSTKKKESDGKHLKKALLKRLQKYGDSLLGNDHDRKKKKGSHIPAQAVKKKKKKKQKRLEQQELAEGFSKQEFQDESEKEVLKGAQKHLQDLKEKLGLTESEIARLKALKEGQQKSTNNEKITGKRKQRPEPEIVVFEDPAKRKERREALGLGPKELPFRSRNLEKSKPQGAEPIEFNIHKARHDIVQFGIKGSDPTTREEAEVALAIKLGAKPPKKKHINYKEFQEMRKKAKEEEKRKREIDRQLGLKVPKPMKQPRARRRGNEGPKFIDGQVGQYKRGVQVLSSHDIDRVKKSKVRKH